MKKFNILACCAIYVCFSSLTSCMKQDISISDDSYFTSIAKEALSSNVCEPAVNAIDALISTYNSSTSQEQLAMQKSESGTTPTINLTSIIGEYPRNYLIDFGTNGYINEKEMTFKGKVYVSIKDKATSKKTYTFTDLTINDKIIDGDRNVELIESGENAVLKITTNENVIYSDKSTTSRISERIRTRISNNNTPTIYTDDSYEFTGSTNGITTKGEKYSVKISKALVSVPDWKYFIKGEITTTISLGTQTLDFGNGEQDDLAISKINNKNAKEFKLSW